MSIIIYPPTADWNWMKQRPQHLMSQLAKRGHIVFYCNKTRTSPLVEEIEPNLFLVHHHEHWLRNEWPSLYKHRQGTIGVWCNLPNLPSAIEQDYAPDWIVYDCADDFGEWLTHEAAMINRAAAVVCSSERLYLRIRRWFPKKPAVLIRNAYDPQMRLHLPHNAQPLEADQVGYVGAWAPWLDEALIRRLSLMNGIETVIVGPEFGKKFILPNHNGNLRFLGLKRHDELAPYIRNFRLCMLPFRITSVTLSVNPVKVYEYLAAGKPVVSTALPECERMAPLVDVVSSHGEFIEAVKHRLEDPGDTASRTKYALEHTWERRGDAVQSLLESL
ncbi:glycosyltransferase [Paenibacillus harenae]|uniref:glycosyltransferase n=1 Tax=Paenibacillus harenae TaxID=306543 RepID=UPI00278E601C|nr:glycosyltransferase [Paenibacillus harenae]MDQ0060249.1 glycosyltransferase involved in cell wall biosynthesis [Paenibacillus harenae]